MAEAADSQKSSSLAGRLERRGGVTMLMRRGLEGRGIARTMGPDEGAWQ